MELRTWGSWALAVLVFGLVFTGGPWGVRMAGGAGRNPERVGTFARSVASPKLAGAVWTAQRSDIRYDKTLRQLDTALPAFRGR